MSCAVNNSTGKPSGLLFDLFPLSRKESCLLFQYVIDVSNRCQVAGACIQLLMMLTHAQTVNTPVLILLNKQ